MNGGIFRMASEGYNWLLLLHVHFCCDVWVGA